MIQKSTRLSDWLSQFMGRINSRGREINSNQFRINKKEMVEPVKVFSKEAVVVKLGKETLDKKSEIITYNNKAAYQNKSNVAQDKKEPPMVTEKTPPTEQPDFKELKQSQFKEFQSAWGSKAGSENYNGSYDFDGNGAIDMVDYLQFGKEFNSAFEGFKQAWGTRSEDAEFASQFDYDSNGVIDMADYLSFGKNWLDQKENPVAQDKKEPPMVTEKTPPTERPDFEELKQSQFKEFQSAWGSKAGSENYNESYDFDGNGAIDMVDYLKFGKEFNSAFEGFKQSWGTRSEDAEFASQFDYDSNGVIDMADYLSFGKNWLA